VTTYGEVTGDLREYLTRVLGAVDVDARLDGAADREDDLRAIQEYRGDILRWTRFAIAAVAPGMGPEEWSRRSSPVSDLLHRLDQIIDKVPTAASPLSDRLSVHHQSSLARDWQGAARSTVLSELVLPAAVLRARSEQQRLVILKDAIDVFHGIVRLDRLYRLVDGWRRLPHVDLAVERAIEMARDLAAAPRDHWIDRFQAPDPGAIEGPLLPGIAGAIQAQHNVEIYLRRPTSAITLRAVLKTQAVLSLRAAVVAKKHAPELAPQFATRAGTYAALVKAARNVGGNTGGGIPALSQSQIAASRLSQVLATQDGDAPTLRNLANICRRVDARVVSNIETGLGKRRYLVAAPDRVLARVPGRGGLHRATEAWQPMTRGDPPLLMTLAHEQLQPPVTPYLPLRTEATREAYRHALGMRPDRCPPPR
jgi:hypothetical protein